MASNFTVEAIPEKGYGLIATNAFRRGATLMHVNRGISTINHSCVPNAHVVATSTGADGQSELVALTHITPGEEITVSYNESLRGTPTAQRKKYLRAAFGIDCECSCCSQDAEAMLISDARRNIINVLWSLKQCIHPVDNSALDRLDLNDAAPLPSNLFEQLPRDPNTIPPVETMGPYCFLLANCLEAEGLVGLDLGAAYYDAALHLRTQMQDRNDGTVVFGQARRVAHWMGQSSSVYLVLLPEHNFERCEFLKSFMGMQRTFELSCGIGAYDKITDYVATFRQNGNDDEAERLAAKTFGLVFDFVDEPYRHSSWWTSSSPCTEAEFKDIVRQQVLRPALLKKSQDAAKDWREGLAAVRRGEDQTDIADQIRKDDLAGELGLTGRRRGY